LRTNINYEINPNNRFFVNAFYNSFLRDANDIMKPLAEQMLENTRNLYKSIIGVNYENIAVNNKLRSNIFYKYYNQNHESIEPSWSGTGSTGELLTEIYRDNVAAHGLGYVLSYEIMPNVFIMTSAERAIRMPNANELFGNDAENILRSPNLKPE